MRSRNPFTPSLFNSADDLHEDVPIREDDLSETEKAEFERYIVEQRQFMLEKFMNRNIFSRILKPRFQESNTGPDDPS